MPSYEHTTAEYLETNVLPYDVITAVAEHALSRPEDALLRVVQPSFSEAARIECGQLSTTAVIPEFTNTTEATQIEVASALAGIQNEVSVRHAVDDFGRLQRMVATTFLTHAASAGEFNYTDEEPEFPFESAESNQFRLTDAVSLQTTTLRGVRLVGDVTEYAFTARDGYFDHVLDIFSINGHITSVRASAEPMRADDMLTLEKLLGDSFGDLIGVLAGDFGSENELDGTLARVLNQTFLSLREQALSMKRARKLNQEYGQGELRPSADRLDEWVARLHSYVIA